MIEYARVCELIAELIPLFTRYVMAAMLVSYIITQSLVCQSLILRLHDEYAKAISPLLSIINGSCFRYHCSNGAETQSQ